MSNARLNYSKIIGEKVFDVVEYQGGARDS